MRREIVLVGQGGQGIVLMGQVLAQTLKLEGKEVAVSASYGAAARGEKCASEIVVSDEPIDFPGVMAPDILVAMSQEGYHAWISRISSSSKVFFNLDTVKTILAARARHLPVPANQKAGELGSQLTANMVMLGAVVAATRLVSFKNLAEVVKKEREGFSDINLKALKEGYKLVKR